MPRPSRDEAAGNFCKVCKISFQDPTRHYTSLHHAIKRNMRHEQKIMEKGFEKVSRRRKAYKEAIKKASLKEFTEPDCSNGENSRDFKKLTKGSIFVLETLKSLRNSPPTEKQLDKNSCRETNFLANSLYEPKVKKQIYEKISDFGNLVIQNGGNFVVCLEKPSGQKCWSISSPKIEADLFSGEFCIKNGDVLVDVLRRQNPDPFATFDFFDDGFDEFPEVPDPRATRTLLVENVHSIEVNMLEETFAAFGNLENIIVNYDVAGSPSFALVFFPHVAMAYDAKMSLLDHGLDISYIHLDLDETRGKDIRLDADDYVNNGEKRIILEEPPPSRTKRRDRDTSSSEGDSRGEDDEEGDRHSTVVKLTAAITRPTKPDEIVLDDYDDMEATFEERFPFVVPPDESSLLEKEFRNLESSTPFFNEDTRTNYFFPTEDFRSEFMTSIATKSRSNSTVASRSESSIDKTFLVASPRRRDAEYAYKAAATVLASPIAPTPTAVATASVPATVGVAGDTKPNSLKVLLGKYRRGIL